MYYRREKEVAKYDRFIKQKIRGTYAGLYKNPKTGVLKTYSHHDSETRRICNRMTRRRLAAFDTALPPCYYRKTTGYKCEIL